MKKQNSNLIKLVNNNKKMKTKIFYIFLFIISGITVMKSQVIIGSLENPDASALLDLKNQSDSSSDKGFLLPRVAITNSSQFGLAGNSLTEGMMVYNTIANTNNSGKGLYYWDGSNWIYLQGIDNQLNWLVGGNTNGTIKTLGTKDAFDLPLITNNIERMRITSSGNVGIGTTAPKARFSVLGGAISQDDYANGDKMFFMGNTRSAKLAHGNGWVFEYYAGSQIDAGGANLSQNSGFYTWNTADVSNSWKETMRFLNNGNVGLGTTTPSAKLDVATGTTQVDGTLTLKNMTGATQLPTDLILSADASSTLSTIPTAIDLNRVPKRYVYQTPNIAPGVTTPITVAATTVAYQLTVQTSANGCGRVGTANFIVAGSKVIVYQGGQSRDTQYTVTPLDTNGSKFGLSALMSPCMTGGGDHEFDFDIEVTSGNVINITSRNNGGVNKIYFLFVTEI